MGHKRKIFQGNLNEDLKENPKRRGWFMGNFLNKNSSLRTGNVEIKWGRHKKGESGKEPARCAGYSLAILIYGKFVTEFPDKNQEAVLEKEGDFVFHEKGVNHSWRAEEDCLLLTARWPSRKKR